MRRIQKFAAINIIAALVGAGIPAMAAQDGYDVHNRGGMQHQTAAPRGEGQWRNDGNRGVRNDHRVARDRGGYDRRDDDRDYHRGGYAYGYAPAPVYEAAPVYAAPGYDYGYYDRRTHDGRTAAIIGGSAAAGALIGAAAGHGQGAVVGAIVGGIAGAVASTAVDHHHR